MWLFAYWCPWMIRGRLSFIAGETGERAGHNAAAPSILLAWGDDNAAALRRSRLGLVYAWAPCLLDDEEKAA